MAVRIPVLSKEYVKVPVTATEAGMGVDLTTATVSMAFVGECAQPVTADWKTASWEGTAPYLSAKALVGPGSPSVLAVGTYSVWVRITTAAEVAVRLAGNLVIV